LDQLLKEPVESLRPALQYLEQNPNEKLSREQWNAIFRGIEHITATAEENNLPTPTQQQQQQESFPTFSKARQEMTSMYQQLQQRGELQLYGAVTTQEPPAAGAKVVPPQLLEQILDLPLSALTPAPATNALLFWGAGLAALELAVSLTTGVSLNALALLTLAAVVLDRLFLNGASLETLLKWISPGVQDKVLKHEAGHFLLAYLLGCPVEGIVLSAWAALRDERFGNRQVSAGTSFFDPELSRQINEQQQVTRSSIDRYSIIVMAGIAAEADRYGRADGGAGDEAALIAFLSRLWSAEQIKNQARWGALQAVLLLRQYRPAYEALVEALEKGQGTLGDCVYAIEKAARDHHLPGRAARRPLGQIVNDNGVAVWEKFVSGDDGVNGSTVTTATAATKSNDTTNDTTESVSTPPPDGNIDDDESALEALRSYRNQVEQKLKDVDEKLKDLPK